MAGMIFSELLFVACGIHALILLVMRLWCSLFLHGFWKIVRVL